MPRRTDILANRHHRFRWILLVAVFVIIAVIGGLIAYNRAHSTYNKSTKSASTNTLGATKTQTTCAFKDKNVCSFLSSWKKNNSYQIESTDTSSGKTTTSRIAVNVPDRYQVSASGSQNYQMILVGTTMYVLDTTDNTWWKQTLPDAKISTYSDPYREDFAAAPEKQTTYKKIGLDRCGTLNCYKYQVSEPDAKDETHFIWFDTDSFLLRKSSTESKAGSSLQTFTYKDITIDVPAPTKDVPENSVVAPGGNGTLDSNGAQDEQTYPDNNTSND